MNRIGIRHDFYGDRGSLHISSKQPITLCDAAGHHIHEHSDAVCNTLLAEDDHFARCLIDSTEPIVTAEDGLEAVRVVEAAYESIRTGRRVSLAEFAVESDAEVDLAEQKTTGVAR